MKISMAEVIGLALSLNRTAVLPVFENCADPNEAYFPPSFDQLFDSSSFSRASVISKSDIDLTETCGDNIIAVSFGKYKSAINFHQIINITHSSEITAQSPLFFGNDIPIDLALISYPYKNHFLPIVVSWGKDLIFDRLLPDKLATLHAYRCIVIEKNYLSLNWARLPKEFDEIHKELLPNSDIQADAVDFFQRNKLLKKSSSQCKILVSPFLGIHLRMGDFLRFKEFFSFSRDCNNNPEILVDHVNSVLENSSLNFGREQLPIILATDDYNSKCVLRMKQDLSVLVLDGESRFHNMSCFGALFDQEVLGSSAIFIGDKLSTFSQAIHQIRTLRNNFAADTTIWL